MDALYPSLRSGNASPRGDILIKKNKIDIYPGAGSFGGR